MSIIQAIILGIVQGASEFIPISSSGHLVLVREIFHWEDPGVIFDIFLHLGTLIAVLIYFRKDWLKIISNLFSKGGDRRMFIYLVIAVIPVFIIGPLVNNYIEKTFRDVLWVSAFLILTGFAFLCAEKYHSYKIEKKTLEKMTWRDALIIGLAQTLALMPGVSRSGATIAAGMFRSLKRTEATRFSFLLATLAITGAGVFGSLQTIGNQYINGYWIEIIIGTTVSAIVGYLSIKYLMKFLASHRLYIFAIYRFGLGIIFIIIQWL